VPNRDAGGCRHYPANMLVVAIPHFNTEGQASCDVVEVRVRKLSQQFVDAEIQFG
jgi:hypothetical protein